MSRSVTIVTSTYPPAFRDGSGLTYEALARRLGAAGWAVTVLMLKPGPSGPCKASKAQPGEIVRRTGLKDLAAVISDLRTRPEDLVITSQKVPLAAELARAVAPQHVLIYFQSATRATQTPVLPPNCHVAFASEFVRGQFMALTGRDGPVLPPIIEPEAYARISSTRGNVLAIGLGRIKRPDIVRTVARRMPHVRFDIFKSWGALLQWRNLSLLLVPNLRVHPVSADPARIYGNARVLIVPSDSEGWCRVVNEAQLAGIPVIARRRTALPESVGEGGVLLPSEATIEEWVAAIDLAMRDEAAYADMVTRARQAAARPTLRPDVIFDGWRTYLSALDGE